MSTPTPPSSPPPNPPDAQAIGSALHRMNQIGTVSGTFFSRVYGALRRRPDVQQLADQARLMERKLRSTEVEVERLNAVIANIEHGVIMQDTEGRLVLVNEAARKLLGGIKAFWESELGNLFNQYVNVTALDSEVLPLSEPVQVQVNNRIIGAQFAAIGDEKGQRLGTLIVLRDVTREMLSERLKEQFVTAISHELRTPMTVIKGISEVMLETPDDAKPNRKLLETLSRNVDILDRMIVELLDISELNADNFAVRADVLDLEALLWGTVNGAMPEIKRAKLESLIMVGDLGEARIRGDEARLRWAIGHLLQNSVRYTEAGGQVVVSTMKKDDQHIALQVTDSGVGISERDLPHVFERFYRGEARNTSGKLIDPRGLGQGLFIARKVTEAHGGYLQVTSQPGEGSTFTMVLPTA